jgi:hypothetical protein
MKFISFTNPTKPSSKFKIQKIWISTKFNKLSNSKTSHVENGEWEFKTQTQTIANEDDMVGIRNLVCSQHWLMLMNLDRRAHTYESIILKKLSCL